MGTLIKGVGLGRHDRGLNISMLLLSFTNCLISNCLIVIGIPDPERENKQTLPIGSQHYTWQLCSSTKHGYGLRFSQH